MITIAGIVFDQHHYDDRGDVLYLNVGAPRPAARRLEIDGGHAVHYDESDSIIGLTMLNIRRTLGTEGYLELTLPVVHIVEAGNLLEAFGRYAVNDRNLRAVEDRLFPMADLPDAWNVGEDGSTTPNWVAALHRSRHGH